MDKKIKRQELWELQYGGNRYMETLSIEELDCRFGDVVSNTTTLDDEGKLAFGTSHEWLESLTHVFFEYRLRGIGVPPADKIQNNLLVPKREGLELSLDVKKQFAKGYPTEFTLFKYGRLNHLELLLNEGKMRLFPASSYSDPSLNPSVQDDELNFTKIIKNKRIRYTSDTDFYCFCSAWLPNNRLVADFEADCIVVIHKPHEFFLRLRSSFRNKDWIASFNKVTYIDPLLMGENDHIESIAFTKHFRYAYQFEHRFIMYPPSYEKKLEYVDLELGSINDIAKIYRANKSVFTTP